jgi:nitroreductase
VDLYDVMRTTGSAREFTPEPVADEVLNRILDHARFAGSGGNRQPWHVLVMRDRARRAALRDRYSTIWDVYLAARARGEVPFSPGWREPAEPAPHLPNAFVDAMVDVPVLLLVLAELGSLAVTDNALDRQSIVAGASVYPFVHNLLLGARNEGLGAVLTTLVARAEDELRELFAIPDTHAIAALVAMGHVERQPTRLTRGGVEAFTTIDTFGGSTFGGR